ncbi:sigma-70 family RNA polymerase sigma factor [Cyclobacterium sp. 1_MG-2023]|uniref:RNA polymerase sigma factor n=1 Tax=Cyclobacterium sp. 1_MG-2023 TaxID=3062681 RepID=UPI0026E124FC|nr:sigma-70 family RNA polymerase sigma factor [Cyclobacterium sp. 1_MG-2023]MDO6436472.1 sigma-70 family RNA polymerase sigma factor [Cyclobacterium sp. 1_MG-2023]
MDKALESLFLKGLEINQQRLFRICRVYSPDGEDAKDLFQEILVQVWRSMDAFKGKSSFSTWMFRIALNVCLQFKSKHLKRQSRLIKLDSITIENFCSEEVTKEPDEKLKHLRTCIKRLNESDMAIITLYLEELAYKEISEILGLTENNVAVKVRRIKSKLFNCMNARP